MRIRARLSRGVISEDLRPALLGFPRFELESVRRDRCVVRNSDSMPAWDALWSRELGPGVV